LGVCLECTLLDFLSQSVPAEDNVYGTLLKKELKLLRDKEDYYLFHEHLEEVNEPLYFYQFIERAEPKRLQYLGEADFSVMSLRNFPPAVEAMVQSVASSLIEIEQYMDFVRNRMFRQTLLCHRDVTLDRSLASERLIGMHIASAVKPEEPINDVRSGEPVRFRGPSAVTTTSDPVMKSALLLLSEIWPQSIPFIELLATARSRLDPSPVVVDTERLAHDARRLADPLIRCYATTQVELSVRPAAFRSAPPDKPKSSPLARHQAEAGHAVTNFRHDTVNLDDLQRHVLRHLDGKCDVDGLVTILSNLCTTGLLVLRDAGKPVQDVQRTEEILRQLLPQTLSQLARLCLLAED
jgi:methyltransferase-like protein